MSLLRLLTCGKSLVGVSGAESRYRLPSQRLLPQFGPARNPFSSRAKAEPAQTEARPPEDHGGNGAPAAKPGLPASEGEYPDHLTRIGAANSQAKTDPSPLLKGRGGIVGRFLANRGSWRRAVALLSGWQAKLRGLLPSGGQAARPAIQRFPKLPVQGELSLDRIKVVRNDLSDADLEVVRAKAPTAPTASGLALQMAEKAEGAKSAWGRITTRILGAGKIQSDEDR